jgi:hypothetical protein
MNYKIFWGFVVVFLISAGTWLASTNLSPRAIAKIKLSEFETTKAISNSIVLRLQEELKANPLWIIGVDPEVDDHLQAITLLVQSEPKLFDEIWVDSNMGLSLSNQTEQAPFQNNIQFWKDKIDALKDRRAVLITPLPYAAFFLTDGPAQQLARARPEFGMRSILLSMFPRDRADEAKMKIPCQRGGQSPNALSPLGCWIADRARLNYSKKMKHESIVGLMDQVGERDYLFLIGREP